MSLIEKLHAAISASCPIDGVSIGNPANKQTWRIDFAANATVEQRSAAQAAVAAFDVAAAEASDAQLQQRVATDRQELLEARVNNAMAQLMDMSPAQIANRVDTVFPSFTTQQRNLMTMVIVMGAIAARPQIRG